MLFCVVAGGCFSSSRAKLDEEKEPYFQMGKSRESARDFDGAIDAFEKALEVNPHSASAHLELGVLYENDNRDCAAAIYHFKRYLELMSTNVPNAGMIGAHILACKQVLARDVMLGPGAPNALQELQRLTDENQRLRDENEKWRATVGAGSQGIKAEPESPSNGANNSASRTGTDEDLVHGPPNAPRTYKVQPGDTMSAISRRSGIKLSALLAANPDVDPKKMRIGQILNLP
jgi:tetratricopeptide (TPR) repeat protein